MQRTADYSREVAIDPERTALLFIDVQNYSVHPSGGEFGSTGLAPEEARQRNPYYFDRLESVALPNMMRLQAVCRELGVEVTYAVIENMTKDGRDRSLDYKISGINVGMDSWDAQVVDAIAPQPDEMVFRKTSSSVFLSTNIHFVLGNLGVKQLIICGCLTDQCVSSAVRDACDLGYLVTLVPDACATLSQERQESSIDHIKGYCRIRSTREVVMELENIAR